MNVLLALPLGLPLAAGALSIVVGASRAAQRVVSLVTLTGLAVVTAVLLVRVDRDGPVSSQAGGWDAPFGITLVADRLSAIMLLVSVLMLLAVLVYAIGQGEAERRYATFHPVYLGLAAGVSAAFITGDLFNLYVSFEVMLTSSYVLITMGAGREQVRAAMTYVVVSLVASALFLIALGCIYAATGTVNLAHLAERLDGIPGGTRQALVLLLLVVFGVKAAIFPLFSWLPDSYPTAPTPVTAVFAGLLTKVGVYAIIRTQTLLLPAGDRPGTLLLAVAGLTMLVGVLGAIAQNDIKRILSFHIVSQIGYMIMGLGLFTVAGLAGALLYIVHHIVVKTTLFLTGGLVEQRTGTGHLDRLGGLVRSAPLVAVLFLLPALSLAGIPPLSGFVAKLALVEAGLDGRAGAVVAVSLVVSLLTLFSMTKIWGNAFWGDVQPADAAERSPALMVLPTAALTALSVAVALAAGPLYALAERAAVDLLDRTAYMQVVLGS